MAIFNPSIYKDISGSVGNVTSYKIGKTQIARAKTRFMKDAKTPKQLQQRARLRLITRLRRNFIAILKTGYCTSSGKTCTNCFTRDNIGKVNAEDWDHPTLDLLTLSLSDGNLRLPLMEAEVNAEKRLVAFRWKKQPLMPFMAKSDQLVGAVYERTEERSRLVKLGSRGESGEKTWTPPADWDMSQLVVYGFAVSENGQDASGTLGLIETEKTDTSVFDTENI